MCTYSDLDCLLSLSSELSIERIRGQIALLSKVFFVCSSTLLYLLFSSLLVSSCLVYLRSHIVHQYQMSLLKHATSLVISHGASSASLQSSSTAGTVSVSNPLNTTETDNEIASLCVLNMRGATMNDYDSIESLLLKNREAKTNENKTQRVREEMKDQQPLSMNRMCNRPRHVFMPSSHYQPPAYNLYQPKTLGKEDMLRNLFSSILVK